MLFFPWCSSDSRFPSESVPLKDLLSFKHDSATQYKCGRFWRPRQCSAWLVMCRRTLSNFGGGI
jgi:hypothetical protein